jgi:hypothetical protein
MGRPGKSTQPVARETRTRPAPRGPRSLSTLGARTDARLDAGRPSESREERRVGCGDVESFAVEGDEVAVEDDEVAVER